MSPELIGLASFIVAILTGFGNWMLARRVKEESTDESRSYVDELVKGFKFQIAQLQKQIDELAEQNRQQAVQVVRAYADLVNANERIEELSRLLDEERNSHILVLQRADELETEMLRMKEQLGEQLAVKAAANEIVELVKQQLAPKAAGQD